MRPCQLLVCESSGQWASGLRRFLTEPTEFPTIRESRGLEHCQADIAQWPESFIVLEATLENIVRVIESMATIAGRFPRCSMAIVTDSKVGPYQWQLRECGAVDVLFSRSSLRRLIVPLRKHWASVADLELGLRASVWDRLPWKAYAAK